MRRRGATAEGVVRGAEGPGGDRGVAQGDEDAGGAGGRGPAQQRRSEGQRSGGGVAVRGHRVAGCNVATVTCG